MARILVVGDLGGFRCEPEEILFKHNHQLVNFDRSMGDGLFEIPKILPFLGGQVVVKRSKPSKRRCGFSFRNYSALCQGSLKSNLS